MLAAQGYQESQLNFKYYTTYKLMLDHEETILPLPAHCLPASAV